MNWQKLSKQPEQPLTSQERDGGNLEDALGGRASLPSRETSGAYAAGPSRSQIWGW